MTSPKKPVRKKVLKGKTAKKKTKIIAKQVLSTWRRPLSPFMFWSSSLIILVFLLITIFNLFYLIQLKIELDSALVDIANSDEQALMLANYRKKNLASESEAQANISTNLDTEFDLDNSYSEQEEVEMDLADFSASADLSQAPVGGTSASFSDMFLERTNIDQNKTDLFWDRTFAAYSFPPKYSLTTSNVCVMRDCGFSRDDIDPEKLCLGDNCLSRIGTTLEYNNRSLAFPESLESEPVLNISIFALESDWLVAFVTKAFEQERARVYRFNGGSFIPIISPEKDYAISTKYGLGGGKVYFGGDDSDLLIFYSGYEAFVYRLKDGKIQDLSHFFGSKLMGAGFAAQIFKLGSRESSDFYICGLDKYQPLLLKIWSDSNNMSVGALDFSNQIFSNNREVDSIICSLADKSGRELMIAANSSLETRLLAFKDLGFDLSKTRKISSVNLNNRGGKKDIKAAVIAEADLKLGSDNLFRARFSLANREEEFEIIKARLWHSFDVAGNELYWRLEIAPGKNTFYSPWFSALKRLDYLFTN